MFSLNPVDWFINIPPEWAVFFISMIPVTELRASIPIGIEVYGMTVWKVWLIAVVGDFIPAVFILYLLPILRDWIMRHKFLGKVLTKELKKAEKRFSGKYERYGIIGLIIFVGIPLPLTGSWTGSLAAVVFDLPFKKAVPMIFAGVCIAATLVTLITLFAGGALRWIL
jgi:uncharacterized membrane protein